MIEKSGFRADLEGLRGVAVLLVLLYHARAPLVDGGYIGVDVFFVLSGFLITGIIVRELMGTGRLSLSGFYARRARRLLPAAALVLVVTMIASAIILPPLRVPAVAGDTISATLYVSNIRFAIQATDYLGSELAPSPVLHFWSLSVEEQFYIFWPTMLAVVAGATFLRGRHDAGIRRLAIVLAAVLVGSLGLSIWLTGVNQPWAFFSLPTRACGACPWWPPRAAWRRPVGPSASRCAGGLDRAGADRGRRPCSRHVGRLPWCRRPRPDDRGGPRHRRRPCGHANGGFAPCRRTGAWSPADPLPGPHLVLALPLALADPHAARGRGRRAAPMAHPTGAGRTRDLGRHGYPAVGRRPDPPRPIRRAEDAPVPGHGRRAVRGGRCDDGIARVRRGRRVERRPRRRRRGDRCRPPSRPDAPLRLLTDRTSCRLAACPRRHHDPVGPADAARDAAATRRRPRTSRPGPAARDCRR